MQFAAFPWRRLPDGVRILLITSRQTHCWLIPKGWPMQNKTAAQAAAQEAYEEAGVMGVIDDKPIGRYSYTKQLGRGMVTNVEVTVFSLEILVERRAWPEQDQREKRWLPPEEAAGMVEEPELQNLIRAFGDDGR